MHEGAGDVVGCHFPSPTNRDVGAVAVRVIFKQHFVPVIAWIYQAVRVGFTRLFNLVVAIHQVTQRIAGGNGLIVRLHVGNRVGQFNVLRGSRNGGLQTGNILAIFLPASLSRESRRLPASPVEGGGCMSFMMEKLSMSSGCKRARSVLST